MNKIQEEMETWQKEAEDFQVECREIWETL